MFQTIVILRFGFDLLAFYAEQPQLCDAICVGVEVKGPYDRPVSGYHESLRLEEIGELPRDSAHELNFATENPIGIEAIDIYYWDSINLLLEQAYALVDAKTLMLPS